MWKFLQKKITPWLGYPMLVVASVLIFVLSGTIYLQHNINKVIAQSGFQPFDGQITEIEYNCLCSLGIKLTIQSQTTQGREYILMFYYGGQILEALGIWPGDIPPPRVYMHYQIWYTGSQILLGNYIPGGFPCVAYVPLYECSVDGYGEGAILNVGTSLY